MSDSRTPLFTRYLSGGRKILLPARLLIIDCFFLFNVFRGQCDPSGPVSLSRLSVNGKEVRGLEITDAYDLYDVDRDAEGSEVVLLHEATGACCYWDLYERYVAIAGPDSFLRMARPCPADIERHRYVEAMLYLEDSSDPEKPEKIYDLVAMA